MTNLKSLYLDDNILDGTEIGPCFWSNLSKLKLLYLGGNNLRSLEGLEKLSNLEELDLRNNQLTDRNIGPWISNLTPLVSLTLYNNSLKDLGILKGLCSLRNLQDLYLQQNSIKGQIPTCLKDVYSLRRLSLWDNLLTWGISHVIFGNLTMMETLDVGNNQLNGVIPFFMFANLSKPSFIDFSNNPQAKVEIEHPHWIPIFQLSRLQLTRCNISGIIPTFLSSQNQMLSFQSDYSLLHGPIPPWILYNVTFPLRLSLRGNMLEGPFPHSSQTNPSMLTKLDISNNCINGTLPLNIGVLLPMLVYLNASVNTLQGNIPSSMGELAMLSRLDLSQNNFSGEMLLGSARDNAFSLRYLDLSNNHIEGQIFARHFNASRLFALFLHNNHFKGTIPWSLLNSRSLMFLDVRNNKLIGSIPSWFSLLPYLASILLGGNYFTGHIPLNFCQMQSLNTLDLSNNGLSGSISSCLHNISSLVKNSSFSELLRRESHDFIPLSSVSFLIEDIRLTMEFTTKGVLYAYEGIPLSMMTGLDFLKNRLTGDIPPQLRYLKELCVLNLSNNYLMGSIPGSLEHLANIESLDLSHNKLTRSIPSQLAQLNFLGNFFVMFNNLSGRIPSGGQFDTFNASNYAGNLELCGPPIEKNCSLDDPPQLNEEEKDDESVLDTLNKPVIFYLWLVFSYALCFSSFALVLIFKENWRWKYFKFVDDYIDPTVEGMRKFRVVIRKWL